MPYVDVDQIPIYYEIRGTGEPLVLILGLGSDVTQYTSMIGELAKTYRVIAFDNRGAGRSAKPRTDYSIELMSNDVEGLLAHLDVHNARVVGISLGSRVAVDLAVRYPTRVRSLILVSVLVRRITDPSISVSLRLAFAAQWLPLRSRRYRQPWYAFALQHAAALDYDTIAQAPHIHVPVLILHGRRDRTAAFRGAVELQEAMVGSRLVAFDGGHLFFRTRDREGFYRALRNGA